MRLKFCTGSIVIGFITTRFSWFQDKGLDALFFHVTKGLVIEVDVMSVGENYLIVDRGGDTYSV